MLGRVALVYEAMGWSGDSVASKLSSLGWETHELDRHLRSLHNVRACLWVVSLVAATDPPGLLGDLLDASATAGLLVVGADDQIVACARQLDRLYDLWPAPVQLLVLPYTLAELELRTRWLSGDRARLPVQSSVIEVGLLRVDTGKRKAWFGDTPIALRDTEFALLAALARAGGDVLTSEALLRGLHGDDILFDEGGIRPHISRLRAALELAGADKGCIRTVHGRGYSLEESLLGTHND